MSTIRLRKARRALARKFIGLGDQGSTSYGTIDSLVYYQPAIAVQGSHTAASKITIQAVNAEGKPLGAIDYLRVRLCNNAGTIVGIEVIDEGFGYTTAPTVTLSASQTSGGTLATATATVYTAAPTVTLSGGGGAGGVATAVVDAAFSTSTNGTFAPTSGTLTETVDTTTSGVDLTLQSDPTGLYTITVTNTTANSQMVLRLAAGLSARRGDYSITQPLTHV